MFEKCTDEINRKQRKEMFQKRKLELLILFRDSLERRISATNATISTLEKQIERNQSTDTNE
tara:strand:+ start:721 stop:906 length:186 start_codon:yes stop_codon:yes gene_type:complete